jgi:hypothetical protein
VTRDLEAERLARERHQAYLLLFQLLLVQVATRDEQGQCITGPPFNERQLATPSYFDPTAMTTLLTSRALDVQPGELAALVKLVQIMEWLNRGMRRFEDGVLDDAQRAQMEALLGDFDTLYALLRAWLAPRLVQSAAALAAPARRPWWRFWG